jgi:hypothetical protein
MLNCTPEGILSQWNIECIRCLFNVLFFFVGVMYLPFTILDVESTAVAGPNPQTPLNPPYLLSESGGNVKNTLYRSPLRSRKVPFVLYVDSRWRLVVVLRLAASPLGDIRR